MKFDACASSYDAYALPQRVFAGRVAEFIGTRPGDRILELGAGTGALTRHLCAVPQVEVEATDASKAMVELGSRAVPQARWTVLDAFAGNVPQAALQVSSGLLQWAREPGQVLRQWKRALLLGGRMVHAFPCEPCLQEWRAVVEHGPLVWRSKEDWCALFEAEGLGIRRTQAWKDQTVLSSGLDLVRGLHRTGVTGQAHLGAGKLRAAIREYDDRYGVPSGVVATWAWIVIEASAGEH